jgi:lysophospholipase L1-like esterase
MSRFSRLLPLAALAGLTLVGACTTEDAILRPVAETPGGELFARYVALGNSITAGTQSAGINDSTQVRAYPVLLAQQAGVIDAFGVPTLTGAGCAPLAAPFSAVRVPPRVPTPLACARIAPGPRVVNNLAVPGALIGSALNLGVAPSPLATFILGGRRPVDIMVEMQPTLVSVWLGNNDALGAALSGNTGALTPLPTFEASLDSIVTRIQQSGARDAILIGVVDPGIVPALQPGVFAWLIKQNPQTAPLLPNPVSNNCAPVGPGGQPNPLAFNLVSLQAVGARHPVTNQFLEISCANDATFVLTAAERTEISTRVAAFNSAIQQRATANGWIYVDPNTLLTPFLTDPAALRKCQGLQQALATGNQAQVAQVVASACPSPDPAQGFGNLISFDGVHPSNRAHRLVANALIEAINSKHQRNIPTLATN